MQIKHGLKFQKTNAILICHVTYISGNITEKPLDQLYLQSQLYARQKNRCVTNEKRIRVGSVFFAVTRAYNIVAHLPH